MKNINIITISGLTLIASCATPPPPPPPPAPIVKSNAPITLKNAPSTEQTALLSNLVGRFDAFVKETYRAAMPLNHSSASGISTSLANSPIFIRSETIDGAKAAAIIAASRSIAFHNGVEKMGAPLGRQGFINRIKSNPSWVRQIAGYEEAQKMASSAISAKLSEIDDNASVLEIASYNLQKEKWAKAKILPKPTLDNMAVSYKSMLTPINYDASQVTTSGTSTVEVNDRIIAAAALLSIRDDAGAVELMKENSGKTCTQLAYLRLRQCVSAFDTPFTHVACLAKHAYSDANVCIRAEVSKK